MSSAAPRKMRDRQSAFYDRSARVMQLTAIRIHTNGQKSQADRKRMNNVLHPL